MTNRLNDKACRYAQIIFLAGFVGQGGVNKDPTVWPDGAIIAK